MTTDADRMAIDDIARAGLEIAEKATPGPMRVNGPNNVCLARDASGHGSTVANTYYGKDVTSDEATGLCFLIAHAGTHLAALCRAVLERGEEIERQRAEFERGGAP